MSLELKWSKVNTKRGSSPKSKRNPARKDSLVVESSAVEQEDLEEGRQGFICFSWSQFQRYIDTCHLSKIQVILEGYLATNPSNKLLMGSSGQKFYSSEILCVRGIYGKKKLGDLFPNRSFVYPFILSPAGFGRNLIPSCASDRLLSVSYRLKSRIVLQDPGQLRSRNTAISMFTHYVAYDVFPNPTPSIGTLDFVEQLMQQPPPGNCLKCPVGSDDGFSAALSHPVARPSDQQPLEVLVRLDRVPDSGISGAKASESRVIATLVQEVCVEDGAEVIRKKVRLFDIRLDPVGIPEVAIPFCLPANLIPTLIEKDKKAKVSYHVKVSLRLGRWGKKEESSVKLPLAVLVR